MHRAKQRGSQLAHSAAPTSTDTLSACAPRPYTCCPLTSHAHPLFYMQHRPGISKDPWSLQEEYVLALMHSKIGNRWQELSRYLPSRPENTVKNHWCA